MRKLAPVAASMGAGWRGRDWAFRRKNVDEGTYE